MALQRFKLLSPVSIGLILIVAACTPGPASLESVIPTGTSKPITAAPTNTLAPTEPPRTPVLIDTDMSTDAIMAILYLLQKPGFSVKAITVTGDGEAHCQPGTEHALGLVAITNAGDIPVACGRETPLTGNHQFPSEFRSTVDSSMQINWPKVGVVSKLTAVELLQETIQTATQPVVIITDGPLTNIAEMLQKDPQLVNKIQMIYIMGGAIDAPGNLWGVPAEVANSTAEFNIWIDPHAANLVVQSGAPITLVPLDVTNQVPLDQVIFTVLSQHQSSPAAQAVYDMLDYTKAYTQPSMFLWDPLTYAIAADNNLATYVTKKITVIEEVGPEIGRTKVSQAGNAVRVAMTTNPDRFYEEYLGTLNGGQKIAIDWVAARATPTPPATVLTVTIAEGKCTLDGPLQVPAGDFGIWLFNKDPGKFAGLAVSTLNPGKTLADLEAWPSSDQPPWLQVVDFLEAGRGEDTLKLIAVKDKPLYLVCFDTPPDSKIGQFGPIELKK